jgi:hypothetical protein
MEKDMKDRELDLVLKDIVVEGVVEEAEQKKLKTYSTLAKLTNLGKINLINWGEIQKADKYAKDKVLNEFGDDMVGNGGGGAIQCNVSYLMDLPDAKKVLTEAGVSLTKFIEKWKEFKKWINKQDDKWKKAHNNHNEFDKTINSIKFNANGVDDKENKQAFVALQELFENEPWKTEVQKGDMAAEVKPLLDEWKKAGGNVPDKLGQGKVVGKDTGKGGSSVGQETEGFHPEHAYKITITSNLTPDWFQKKYKGGLINKMIMGIKTGAMHQLAPNSKNPMKDHKYVQNEMLPQDERKLEKLKWEITNKVAKTYITNLLGWSRKKLKKIDEKSGDPVPAQGSEPKADIGYGKKLADTALSNRGIMGRLRQQIFSGGQKSEQISVAFQLSDPNDDWKFVKEDGEVVNGGAEGEGDKGDGGKDGSGGAGSGTGAVTGGKGNPGKPGAGSNGKPGSGGPDGGNSVGGAGSGNGPTSGSGNTELTDKEMKQMLSLLQRVQNLEKFVHGKTFDESTDKDVDSLIMEYING